MNEENNFNTVGEPSTIDTPVTPVQEPVVNSTGNNTPKKGGSIKAVVVILIILLLGAIGYILYTKGVFGGEKKDNTKTEEKTSKDSNKSEGNESTDKSKDSNYLKVDFSKYEKSEGIESYGPFKVNGVDYMVKMYRYDCVTKYNDHYDECYQTEMNAYHTNIYITKASDGDTMNHFSTSRGIIEIAVLDNRYLYFNTGEYGDSQTHYEEDVNAAHIILDGNDSFEIASFIGGDYASYYEMNNGTVGKEFKRTVGYVDKNTYRVGTCVSSGDLQKYIEYDITVKDGTFTPKEVFSKDGIFCSAQHE